MKRPPTILYCGCACAKVLPDDVRSAVLDGLLESGAAMEAVADLCELAARRDPRLKRFAEGGAVHIVACHPRAVRWLFAYAGAPLAEAAVIHNMRQASADVILRDSAPRGLAPREHTGGDRAAAPAPPPFPARKPGEWVPWFPVIDYDRCKACRQCAEFCLFGVYATDEGGRVRVVQPDKCKTGCPACARVCPESAIIFPKFKEGPISGDEGRLTGSAEDGLQADLAGLSKADAMVLLRRRNAARAKAAAKLRQERPGP